MKHFPDFIKSIENKVDTSQQHTKDIEGYYFEGKNDTQIAFWEYHSDQVAKKHSHDFDEYLICVSGEYTVCFDDKEIVLHSGDEILVPKGVEHWGKSKAGTKTIYAFDGKRIK